jgi:DNA-binding MarR family transcriptional regulator
MSFDIETRVQPEDHAALRLWLRLLTCTQLVEKQIRTNLREDFSTTLPRFDLMAQIEKFPQGLKMNELSARMMVSGGNITAIVDQLQSEALVERFAHANDKRATLIKLTPAGRKYFTRMAREHEAWIIESFAGLEAREVRHLHSLLGKAKKHLIKNQLQAAEA